MSSRPENYERLTRDQVGILENHFDKGMKSTKCSQLIEKAAEETLLPVEKIKVQCLFYCNYLYFSF
jgi:hypothetical protein